MLHIDPDGTELHVYQTDGADATLDDPAVRASDLDADVVVPAEHIESADVSERLNERKDAGTIAIHNPDGIYTDAITTGDRFEFWVRFRIAYLDAWGDGAWGDGAWGGQRAVWTGWVGDRTLERLSPGQRRLILECDDFIFGVLGERITDVDVPGGQAVGSLVSMLETEAPEIRLAADPALDRQIDAHFSGTDLFDAVDTVMRRARVAARGHRDMMIVAPITADEVTPRFTITGDGDITTVDNRESDVDLVNAVRIDGGRTASLDASQEEFNHWERVFTPDDTPPEDPDEDPGPDEVANRIIFPVRTRKSEVAEIHLYTRNVSDDRLTVRLQADDPNVELDDRQSDIAQRTLATQFISREGWTNFLMPSHTLPEPNPRVIVESDGELGHFLGVGLDGPMHRVFYPYNVVTRQEDQSSIDDHRHRAHRITDDTITRFEEAHAIAEEVLDHQSRPDSVVHTTAESLRAHMLRPGQVVELDFPDEAAVGEYLVLERSFEYDGTTAMADLSLREVASV